MVHPYAIWYDILSCREKFESREAKWCIVTYGRRRLGIREGITPRPPSFFIAKMDFYFFSQFLR